MKNNLLLLRCNPLKKKIKMFLYVSSQLLLIILHRGVLFDPVLRKDLNFVQYFGEVYCEERKKPHPPRPVLIYSCRDSSYVFVQGFLANLDQKSV